MLKAVMDYNIDDMKAYCSNIRGSKSILIFYIVMFAVYSAGVIVFALLDTPLYAMAVMIGVQILILALLIILVLTVVRTAPKRELDRINAKYSGQPLIYEFEQNAFFVYTEGMDKANALCVEYRELDYAVETIDYFFLADKEYNDFAVRKTAFSEGAPEQLREILVSKVNDKYKTKNLFS